MHSSRTLGVAVLSGTSVAFQSAVRNTHEFPQQEEGGGIGCRNCIALGVGSGDPALCSAGGTGLRLVS